MEERRLADAALGWRHVFVRGLTVAGRIGVGADERAQPQRLRISVDLAVHDDAARNLSRPRISRDELSHVVDYSAVAAEVRRIVGLEPINLVETLAERIAEACLLDARIHVARVRVEKPDVMVDADSVGVEIERRR
jgi:dihydroneopterin aldolase